METYLIEKLKKYFKQRKDIAFAFLYGSEAKEGANKLSDVDIAVYFIPLEHHPIEFEKD
jgi:predicted nucleotidyltransferase